MSKGTRFVLCAIAGVLVAIAISLTAIAGIAREYVDIGRQTLELSRQQYEDNAAMTARVMEMVEATQAPTEPPTTMSQAGALDVLRGSLRREAERKESGE
jgi:hypothetical protein